MRAFLAGFPSEYGGANVEAWDTIRLWRKGGVDVTLIPTWGEPPVDWRVRVEAIGCHITVTPPERLANVSGLAGAIVISFCNQKFLEHAWRFQDLGCRIVWVGCMIWCFPQEKLHYIGHYRRPPYKLDDGPIRIDVSATARRKNLFTHYVFQSNYQRTKIVPQLRHVGWTDDMGSVFSPAFAVNDWLLDPRPHAEGERFVIGRISRAAIDKYPADLWTQYGRVPYPTSARCMGWDATTANKCGEPPVWAEVLPGKAEPAATFYQSIHALVPGVGCCRENWPRVGLEAMASGVPIVAENIGGWREQLADGGGLLADSIDHQAYLVARLAYDRQYRMDVLLGARNRVERLTDPAACFDAWVGVFDKARYDDTLIGDTEHGWTERVTDAAPVAA